MVGGPIFLTLQSPNMISVIDAVLWLHICTLVYLPCILNLCCPQYIKG